MSSYVQADPMPVPAMPRPCSRYRAAAPPAAADSALSGPAPKVQDPSTWPSRYLVIRYLSTLPRWQTFSSCPSRSLTGGACAFPLARNTTSTSILAAPPISSLWLRFLLHVPFFFFFFLSSSSLPPADASSTHALTYFDPPCRIQTGLSKAWVQHRRLHRASLHHHRVLPCTTTSKPTLLAIACNSGDQGTKPQLPSTAAASQQLGISDIIFTCGCLVMR